MVIAKGEPILASDVLAIVNNVTNLQTKVTALQTTVAGKENALPVGTILMYNGAGWSDNVTLKGWAKCDGAAHTVTKQDGANVSVTTPNLLDKFIMGGSSSGGTGGANDRSLSEANLPRHNHTLSGTFTTGDNNVGHTHSVTAAGNVNGAGTHDHSINDPGHEHDIVCSGYSEDWGYPEAGGYKEAGMRTYSTAKSATGVGVVSGGGSHAHTFAGSAVTSGGISVNHTHNVTLSGNTGDKGSGTSFDNRPAYYTLIYIMKCV